MLGLKLKTMLVKAATGYSELRSLKMTLYIPYKFRLNVDLVYVSECVMQDRLVCAPYQWDDITMWHHLSLAGGMHGMIPGGRLNKKDGLTRYGDSHVKDKTS